MSFLQVLYFSSIANCSAPLLSLYTIEKIFIAFESILIYEFRKSIIYLIGMRSRVLCNKAMYSAFIVDKSTSTYILDIQCIR